MLQEFRKKLLAYPDYVIWAIKQHWQFYTMIFGVLIILFFSLLAYNTKQLLIKNKQQYIEVYTDLLTTVHPLVLTNHLVDNSLKNLIYTSLIRTNANGSYKNILLNTFTVKNTYKEYTIELKNTYNWNNKTQITGADIAFTYNFIKDNFPNLPVSRALENSKIKVLDKNHIRFILNEPYVGFINTLIYPIANSTLYKNKNMQELLRTPYETKLITSGPYKLIHLDLDYLTLESVKDPKFKIKWNYQRTPEIAYAEFISHKADAYVIEHPDQRIIKRLRNNPQVILTRYPIVYKINGLFINMHSKSPLARDATLRQELLKAISPHDIIKQLDALPAYSIYPSTAEYINKDLIKLRKKQNTNSSDDFKRLKSITINISFLDVPDQRQTAKNIANILKQKNLNVKLVPINIEDFDYTILQQHKFDVLLYGIQTSSDPDQSSFWHSKGNLNIIGLNDPEVDKLLEQGLTTYNTIQRNKLYQELQKRIVQQQAVFIPLFHPNLYVAYYKYVHHLNINTDSLPLSNPSDRVFFAYPYMK